MAVKFTSRREVPGPQANISPIYTHFRNVGESEVALISKDGLWKYFNAERISDRRPATVCLCEKKALELACKNKKRYEQALDVFRREVANLDKFRHPNIVTLIHPLEETPLTLAYATERVADSLESLLLRYADPSSPTTSENDGSSSPSQPDSLFDESELKYGLLQVTEGLKFLHNVKHTSHRNVSIRTIFITPNGMWKLGGLAFIDKLYQDKASPPASDYKQPLSARPDLDFQPPEAVPLTPGQNAGNASLSAAGDMFSFGLVICAICNRRPILNTGGNIEKYAIVIEQLNPIFKNSSSSLPVELIGAIQRMLTRDATQRITAQSFALLKYFHDEDVMLLQNLDSLQSKAPQQRSELFRKLRDCLPKLSKKIVFPRVLPLLVENVGATEYDVPVVQAYLTLIRQSSNIEFRSAIFATLRQVIGGMCTEAAMVTLLENADVLCAKLNAEELETLLVPLIIRALEGSSTSQHLAALKALPGLVEELDEGDSETKKLIRDVLIRLIERPVDASAGASNAMTKAQCLSCVYLVTQHDLAMKFALEQLLEQQLQHADVFQALISHIRSLLEVDLQSSYVSDFALPAIIRPLGYCDTVDESSFACAFDLVYRLLEKLEVMKTGTSRVTHCLHRPKLIHSSAQTDITGSVPPLIKTDACDSDQGKSTSAVKRFLGGIYQTSASTQDGNGLTGNGAAIATGNGFVRVTADDRNHSFDVMARRGSGNTTGRNGNSENVGVGVGFLKLDATSKDQQHTNSTETINQRAGSVLGVGGRCDNRASKLDIPFVANPLARRLSVQVAEARTTPTPTPTPTVTVPIPSPGHSPSSPSAQPTRLAPASPRAYQSQRTVPSTTAAKQPLLGINSSLTEALYTRRKSFNNVTDAVTSLFQKK